MSAYLQQFEDRIPFVAGAHGIDDDEGAESVKGAESEGDGRSTATHSSRTVGGRLLR